MKANDVVVEFKPLTTWPGEPTPARERQDSRFKRPSGVRGGVYQTGSRMPVGKTVTELRTELAMINAANVMILLDTDASQIKKDGWPRSGARVRGPGVILIFELANVGAVSYPCDTFTRWEDNLRAITLSLKALRSVNRYGVAKRQEQYTGWKALPPGSNPDMTPEQAARFLALHTDATAQDILSMPFAAGLAFRNASKRLHPDAGGSADDFAKLSAARAVLMAHHGQQKLTTWD
jgi:hypothetical protein